jgi:hypothetical protein
VPSLPVASGAGRGSAALGGAARSSTKSTATLNGTGIPHRP